jgi:hypothetical protein
MESGVWVTRQEARTVRLFLSALFFGQALVETIVHDYEITRIIWLWAFVAIAFFVLWIMEIILIALVDITKKQQDPILPTVYTQPKQNSYNITQVSNRMQRINTATKSFYDNSSITRSKNSKFYY